MAEDFKESSRVLLKDETQLRGRVPAAWHAVNRFLTHGFTLIKMCSQLYRIRLELLVHCQDSGRRKLVGLFLIEFRLSVRLSRKTYNEKLKWVARMNPAKQVVKPDYQRDSWGWIIWQDNDTRGGLVTSVRPETRLPCVRHGQNESGVCRLSSRALPEESRRCFLLWRRILT